MDDIVLPHNIDAIQQDAPISSSHAPTSEGVKSCGSTAATKAAVQTTAKPASSTVTQISKVDILKLFAGTSSSASTSLGVRPAAAARPPSPGLLDLSSARRSNILTSFPSALATARIICNLGSVPYPEGVKRPSAELNIGAKDNKFRYDREFLLQFMSICKGKPDMLPPLDAIGLEPSEGNFPMGRGGSGCHRQTFNASAPQREASVGGFPSGSFGKASSNPFSMGMGNFGTTTSSKLSSDERFNMSTRTASIGSASGFRPSQMQRTASQGGPGAPMYGSAASLAQAMLERVAPLQPSANRWDRKSLAVAPDFPEIVDRKVKGLLNKLTMEKFDSISDQIIAWANKSENEKDSRTLIQVIRLVFEHATIEASTRSAMYARLCRKMMEQISNRVQDDGIKGQGGVPITGGHLFRKYLLNRCQEDFERGWVAKETIAAAAPGKVGQDEAGKAGNEDEEGKEVALYSNEYYAAQKAKCQGLGLIKFMGELFKLQMLTERIMHECVKALLGNVDNPEEGEIESVCTLFATVGEMLDTQKARAHMDVYFSRMKEVSKKGSVSPRLRFMLQDIIELRKRRWVLRHPVEDPETRAQIYETLTPMERKYAYLNRRRQSRFPTFGESESDFSQSSDEEVQVETMSVAEAKEKITQYSKEFFATRDLEEAELYFSELPAVHHYLLVDDLVYSSVESSEADARLVGDFFARVASKRLCFSAALEAGIALTAEFLDDIASDAPGAPELLAIMMKGARLSDVRRERIAAKSQEHCDKLLELSKPRRLPYSFRRDVGMSDVGEPLDTVYSGGQRLEGVIMKFEE